MNTVTLPYETYRGAELYAEKQNLSVDDFVNKVVLNVIFKQTDEKAQRKPHTPSSLLSLCNILKDAAKETTDEELRDEYLNEKYGV